MLWHNHVDNNSSPDTNFLLYPDIHGLLLASTRLDNSNASDYIRILQTEYAKYLSHNIIFAIDPRYIIPGTHIALTLDFYNPDVDKHSHPDHTVQQV